MWYSEILHLEIIAIPLKMKKNLTSEMKAGILISKFRLSHLGMSVIFKTRKVFEDGKHEVNSIDSGKKMHLAEQLRWKLVTLWMPGQKIHMLLKFSLN